jgi:hypothetical protein
MLLHQRHQWREREAADAIAAANPSMPTATAHAAETICLYAS